MKTYRLTKTMTIGFDWIGIAISHEKRRHPVTQVPIVGAFYVLSWLPPFVEKTNWEDMPFDVFRRSAGHHPWWI